MNRGSFFAQALAGLVALAAWLAAPSGPAWAADWLASGFVAADLRLFPSEPAFAQQRDVTLSPSLFAEARLSVHPSAGPVERLTLVPFGRWDAHDARRTHADLREANLLVVGGDWDLVLGVDRRHWGVVESRHLVDIINQTDQVEDLDGRAKLGQPMINLNWVRPWGTLGLFVLPGFRERTFPAADARLRGPFPIAHGDARYESGAGERHVDAAVRYFHAVGPLDIGLAHFRGTSREPRFLPRVLPGRRVELIPVYDQIEQSSVDAQVTRGRWLWKLEAITHRGHGERFQAAIAGVEYTWPGVLGSRADAGLLAEYLYDGRSPHAPLTPYDDDVFLGLRLHLNDAATTTVLLKALIDRSHASTVLGLEAHRRLGRTWRISLDARMFRNVDPRDLLTAVHKDGFVEVRLARYF